jgi:hypothetical protein
MLSKNTLALQCERVGDGGKGGAGGKGQLKKRKGEGGTKTMGVGMKGMGVLISIKNSVGGKRWILLIG